jgi:hypothetical protein
MLSSKVLITSLVTACPDAKDMANLRDASSEFWIAETCVVQNQMVDQKKKGEI